MNHMTRKIGTSRKLGASLVVLFALVAMGAATTAQAASAPPSVYPPQARPYGLTYSQWAVRFVRWLMAIPVSHNPWTDSTGAYCAEGQSGSVWYLLNYSGKMNVAGYGGGTTIRTCTVPAGKAVLISPDFWECSTIEGDGNTFADLSSCAKGYADEETQAGVTVDGVHLTNLLTRYRFATPLFTFKYPADNLLQMTTPGVTNSAADAFFVILAPLAAGPHTVEVHAVNPPTGESGDVTYHLTVRG
jgi:hypothetical protein